MKEIKQFEEFIKEGIVKKVSINTQRAKSLTITSERKRNSLNEHIEKIGVNDTNANDYIEYCYDLILGLIRAKLCIAGYNASGLKAHEAEIAYMQILNFDIQEIKFLDQVRYYRNGILYYGTFIDAEYANKVIIFTKKIYPQLRKLIDI